MLFDIKPGLAQSTVFEELNSFLKEIILAALEGRAADASVMVPGLHAAVIGNQPSQNAVNTLVAGLTALEQDQKDSLRGELLQDLDPCSFLTDRTLQFPAIPELIFPDLKSLSVHLYARTVKLSAVETACGECVNDHYTRFRNMIPPGNGNVCCACGTESLAQLQAGVDDDEQWRGPYDHLLAKDNYPLYGIHPRNLVPICQTCNSKAKLAKDLLIKDGVRRLSFSPWTECASIAEIQVLIDDTDVFPKVVVNFVSDDGNRREKLETWNDVYDIKARVEGEFLALHEKVAEDASTLNEVFFLESLTQRALVKMNASRLTPFNYWRARVYRAVSTMNQVSREALRAAIAEAAPRDDEMDALFY